MPNTFQSGLPKFFSKVGVILALMSSRGSPSDGPADVEDAVSKTLTVLFGGAAAPYELSQIGVSENISKKNMTLLQTVTETQHTSKGFFSYSASRALRSAGLTSLKKPLMSAGRFISKT